MFHNTIDFISLLLGFLYLEAGMPTTRSTYLPSQGHRVQVPPTSTSGIDPSMAAHFGSEGHSSVSSFWKLGDDGGSGPPFTEPGLQLRGGRDSSLLTPLGHGEDDQASHRGGSNASSPPVSHDRSNISSPPISIATTLSSNDGGIHIPPSHVDGSGSAHAWTPHEGSEGGSVGRGYAGSSEHSSPNQSITTLTDVSPCSQNESHLPPGGTEQTAVTSDTAVEPVRLSDEEDSLPEDGMVPPEHTSDLDSDLQLSESSSIRSLSPIPPLDSPLTSPHKEEEGKEKDSQHIDKPGFPPAPSSDPITHHPPICPQGRTASHRPLATHRPTPHSFPSLHRTTSMPHPPPLLQTDTESKPQDSATVQPTLQGARRPYTKHLGHPLRTAAPPTVPGIRLPNFFMPPHELEQSMRSLRALALSRPPPRLPGLLPTQQSYWSGRENGGGDSSSGQRTFRTVHEINEYLESRRAQVAEGDDGGGKQQPPQQRPKERTVTETERIARIFSSKPTQSPNV